MSIRTNRYGKKVLQTSVSVDVDESFDVNVDIQLDEIIKDLEADDLAELLFDMGKEGRQALSKYFSLAKEVEFEGEKLKRHLCDIAGISYHTSVNELANQLVYKLNS